MPIQPGVVSPPNTGSWKDRPGSVETIPGDLRSEGARQPTATPKRIDKLKTWKHLETMWKPILYIFQEIQFYSFGDLLYKYNHSTWVSTVIALCYIGFIIPFQWQMILVRGILNDEGPIIANNDIEWNPKNDVAMFKPCPKVHVKHVFRNTVYVLCAVGWLEVWPTTTRQFLGNPKIVALCCFTCLLLVCRQLLLEPTFEGWPLRVQSADWLLNAKNIFVLRAFFFDLPAFRLFSMVSSQYFSSLGFWPLDKPVWCGKKPKNWPCKVIGDHHPKYGWKKLETNQVSKTLGPLWHHITIAALDMIASAGRPAPREYQHLGSNQDFVWGLSNNYFIWGGRVKPTCWRSEFPWALHWLLVIWKEWPHSVYWLVDREDAGYWVSQQSTKHIVIKKHNHKKGSSQFSPCGILGCLSHLRWAFQTCLIIWFCPKAGYTSSYSHLIGIYGIYNDHSALGLGVHYFQTNPLLDTHPTHPPSHWPKRSHSTRALGMKINNHV